MTSAVPEPARDAPQWAPPSAEPAPAPERVTGREVLGYLLGRAWRAVQAVATVIRPIGWAAITGAILLWTLGPMFGWRELTTGAIALTVVIVACALFLLGRTAHDIDLVLARDGVIVGDTARGEVAIANTTATALAAARIVLPIGRDRGVFSVRRLASGENVAETFEMPTRRRGVLPVGPVSVLRGDPLGLFERVERRADPVELFVHPRTAWFGGESLGFVRDLEGLPTRDLARDDIAFHALSEYQPGDDLRHVHWRSTARTGTMMVRTYEETRRSHFVIGLSRSRDEYRSDAEFELAVSIAASVARRGVRDSFDVELRTQLAVLRGDDERRMLDSFSRIEHARIRDGIDELGAVIGSEAPSASFVTLVTGRGASTSDVRAAVSRIPSGARALVCVADEDADPTIRRIGDADVVSVGRLDQLPRVMRRVLG